MWWMSHLQNSEYGNIWRTTEMGPSYITWSTYPQFLLINSTSTHINSNRPIILFISTDESIDDTPSLWTLFAHTEIYIMAIGLLIPTRLGIYCGYFFWCRPAILACQSLWSGSLQHTIVDDDVEAPHLKLQWHGWTAGYKTTWESWPVHEIRTYMDKESTEATSTVKSKAVTPSRSLDRKSEIQGIQWAHMVCCKT